MIRARSALALALLAPASIATADVITMRDGRVLEGAITSETSRLIAFDTRLNGIRTTMSLDRRQIGSIERKALPEGFFETRPARKPGPISNAADRKIERRDAERNNTPAGELDDGVFMAIPARGIIGQDITAAGIRDALEAAEDARARHIVFLINSPGGYAYEALQIRAVLDEFRGRFTFHAYIEDRALSAATVLAAGSETIHTHPLGTMGAAVSYTQDAQTGNVDVDAKFNSAWAASIASLASSRGHAEEPFRAMVVRDVELYAREVDGVTRFSAAPPTSKRDRREEGWERLDDANTILTLTGSQIDRLGIGSLFDDSVDHLGDALGLDRWEDAGDRGARAMQAATDERARLGEAIQAAIQSLGDQADEAKRDHPLRLTLVRGENHEITPQSRQDWTRAVSRSRSAWRRVQTTITRIERLKSRAEQIGALHMAVSDESVSQARQNVQDQLDWLRRNASPPRTTADIPTLDD